MTTTVVLYEYLLRTPYYQSLIYFSGFVMDYHTPPLHVKPCPVLLFISIQVSGLCTYDEVGAM